MWANPGFSSIISSSFLKYIPIADSGAGLDLDPGCSAVLGERDQWLIRIDGIAKVRVDPRQTEIGDLPEAVDALLTGRTPPPNLSRKSQRGRIPIDLLAALSDDREPLADLG